MSKLFIILMLTCNFTWLYSSSQTQQAKAETTITLPEKYQNRALQQCSLSHLEQKFAKQFPGIIETYQHPTGVIIFRQVNGATRKLHDSRTCLKSSGFTLSEPKPEQDEDGIIWQSYTAQNEVATLSVRSVILSQSDEKHWSSVEQWFWAAFFSSSNNSYLAITEINDR